MYFAIYVIMIMGSVEVLVDDTPHQSFNECQIEVMKELPALQKAKQIKPLRIICQSFDLEDA